MLGLAEIPKGQDPYITQTSSEPNYCKAERLAFAEVKCMNLASFSAGYIAHKLPIRDLCISEIKGELSNNINLHSWVNYLLRNLFSSFLSYFSYLITPSVFL